MSEAEAKLLVRKFIEYSNYEGYIDFNDYIANQDIKAIETILQLLEKKDKRIDELEKALVEEDLKHRNKIKELEADLYSANKTIDDYIEERRILKDKIKEELNYCNTSRNQYDKCDLQCKFYEKLLDIMGE